MQHSHENSHGLKLKQTAQHAQMKGKNEHGKGKIFLSFLPPTKLRREMLCSLSMGETIQVTVWIRTSTCQSLFNLVLKTNLEDDSNESKDEVQRYSL